MEHTVTFRLRHAIGSPGEADFLAAAASLAAIPGVRDFAIRRQVSPKNEHTHGITMRFGTDADFRAYCDHPAHVAFVEMRWLPEVLDFREADFAEA